MSSQPITPPITETTTTTYSTYTVQLQTMELNVSAVFLVGIYDVSGELIEYKNLVMSGEDYQLWKSDDYVYYWVNVQLHKTSA